jgi:hypothetical protein
MQENESYQILTVPLDEYLLTLSPAFGIIASFLMLSMSKGGFRLTIASLNW